VGEVAAVRAGSASVTAGAPLAAQTRRLLDGPVTSTLLRLAAPNVLMLVLQAAVTTLDAVYVGWLGSPALAGVSLVFPPADADHVRGRHGRGRGLGGRAGAGRGPPRRRRRALSGLYIAIALALVVFGVTVVAALKVGAWR
jgi:hypothetical protein